MGAGGASRPEAEQLRLVRCSARGADRCRPSRRQEPGRSTLEESPSGRSANIARANQASPVGLSRAHRNGLWAPHSTRLETRTKEPDMRASRRVLKPGGRKEANAWDPLLLVHRRPTQILCEGFECEHACWDPKDGELCLSGADPEETLVEARSDTDMQIVHLTRVGWLDCFDEPCHGIEGSKWAIFGKQNWRCGMNQKLGYGAQLHANPEPTKGVGRLRQQDGGHGSRNPLRSV
ncbi:hypothetical protein M5K25_009041 [Dendrobium thyrsiflorum]|uniref:Uncharacterized protein n=1 Tax=Dendrobium thyrsiflorum TaxID=117978 RepID=A0ABD0V4U3_DENTH